MSNPALEIRDSDITGRGVFAVDAIAKGDRIIAFTGWLVKTAELTDDLFALQVGDDHWLCSHGDQIDDCINHSCSPNAGFLTGEAVLFALRDIPTGEEICFDYSTSINESGWRLECSCGSRNCRKLILPWREMPKSFRQSREHVVLAYLRGGNDATR